MFVLKTPCNLYEKRSAKEQKADGNMENTVCFSLSSTENPELFCLEGMLPVNLQPNPGQNRTHKWVIILFSAHLKKGKPSFFSKTPKTWKYNREAPSWYHALNWYVARGRNVIFWVIVILLSSSSFPIHCWRVKYWWFVPLVSCVFPKNE